MRHPSTLRRGALLVFLCGSSFALADRSSCGGAGGPELAFAATGETLKELLSGVDFVPPKQLLGDAAVEDLITIARDPDVEAGVRIRAYRALSLYPQASTEAALYDAIAEHSADGLIALASTGVDTILLRAAMDSMAVVARARGVDVISDQLNHQSRDVRAAAAYALAVCGSLTAVPLLRERLKTETVPQVQLAIEKAIRTLVGEDPISP